MVLGQRVPEGGQMPVSLEPAEAGLRLHHSGSSPAQRHRGIAPSLHVARHTPDRALHVLDGIGAGERAAQLQRQSEAIDGQDLIEASTRLAATPRASRCMRFARPLMTRSVSAASSSSQALRNVRRRLVTCFFGQRSAMLRAL
jgi:hypothetical protein